MYRLKTWPERESQQSFIRKNNTLPITGTLLFGFFQLEAGLIQLRMEVASKRVSHVRIFDVLFQFHILILIFWFMYYTLYCLSLI
jgi:hypothetical protein